MLIGALTIIADFGLVYLELNDRLPAPAVMHTPLTRWVFAIIPFGTTLALQFYATHLLRTGLIAMQREMLKSQHAEKVKDETLFKLSERVKELNTLYRVSSMLHEDNSTWSTLVREIANVIPTGWQYPDITAARVCCNEIEFATPNYRPSAYSQLAETTTASGTSITIEVLYLQPMPEMDEGPFMKEKRDLINMLVKMIKIELERRERKAELKDYQYALDISSIIGIFDEKGTIVFVNENFCNISKYSQEELAGQHCSMIWSGIHLPAYFQEMESAMQDGALFKGEFCNKAKDGSLYWVETTMVPFLDESGNIYQYLAISHDISSRKEAEFAIKEQTETFRAIIDNTNEAIFLISPEYRILQYNSTAFGRVAKNRGLELQVGNDFRDYLYEQKQEVFYSIFEDSLKGIHRTEETCVTALGGRSIWFQSKTSPVYNLRGELLGVRLLIESIDERKRAEGILRESEEKFRSIVEHSLVGIFIIQEHKLVYVNPGFEKIFGYTKEQLLYTTTFEELVHKDDVELVESIYNQKISQQESKEQFIIRGIHRDKAMLYLEVISNLISYNNQPAVIGTIVNITDRIQEETRINKALLDAQERQRLQIGMELHDNVKQILAGTGLFLELAQRKLDDKEKVNALLDELKKYNRRAIDELRRLSHQLAPLVEENSGLNEKINWLVRSMKLDEISSVSVNIDEFRNPLDNHIQLAVYRILQEQLTNVVKYANASAIEINVRSVNGNLLLQAKDNGKGFDTHAIKEGIGLENIRRRVWLLEGKAEVISPPGEGCEISIQIPIACSEEES